MDKLVITVTVDSSMSYPANSLNPPIEDTDAFAAEYIRAVNAGASITHIHGVHKLEQELQPDGRRLSRVDIDGWAELQRKIVDGCHPVMQFGIASARFEEKVALMDLHPDMMSIAFNAHDEHFQPDKAYPANEIYASHPRAELEAYSRAALERGVKVEVESFQTGAYWNMQYVAERGVLPEPIWTTIFLGWPGGTWTPPSARGLMYMVEQLPSNRKINWNTSVMDPPTHWQMLNMAILLGGHVRVGWEDNPYLPDGTLATTNALLVEKVVRMARELGREVATPEEARQIVLGSEAGVSATVAHH
jgi:3-keto-5-aminohexanoate cleavage enzyme